MNRENRKGKIFDDKGYCRANNSNDRYFNYYKKQTRLGTKKFDLSPSYSNFSETKKQDIRNYVLDLLGNDPTNCYKEIIYDNRFGSLRTISDQLGISRSTLRAYISTWLEILYGKNAVEEVIRKLWPRNSAKQKEKIKFYENIEKYIRLYPERTSIIPTRNNLLKGEFQEILSKNTFKPWVIDYLVQIKSYNHSKAYMIYDVIWGKNCALREKIQYENIIDFVQNRSNGKACVLTPRIDFDSMQEYPTDRYLKISCGEGHEFRIQVRKLIYDYNWCPYCNELVCERIMRNYLSQFFKAEFKAQVRLEQACGIDREKVITRKIEKHGKKYVINVFVGQLRYDHFCPNVYIMGNDGGYYEFAIAGEYDGFYHDELNIQKNPFCSNMGDFVAINVRDSIKNEISYRSKVILIRLKEKDGFTRRKLLKNQKQVMQTIIKQFNEQVKDLFHFNDILVKYDPYIRYDPLGKEVPYRIHGSLDDFL